MPRLPNKLFQQIVEKLKSGLWKVVGIVLLLMLTGPGVVSGYELALLLDMLGADFFLLMYLAGLLYYLQPIKQMLVNAWRSCLSVTADSTLEQDVNYLVMGSTMALVNSLPKIMMTVACLSGIYWLITSQLLLS